MMAEKDAPQSLTDFIAEQRATGMESVTLKDLEAWQTKVTPLMTVEHYCRQFAIWSNACRDESDGSPWAKSIAEAFETIHLAVYKSNLLFRLIYGGEKLRTEKCPIHQGRWSGCVPDPCPICAFDSDVTGWKRHELTKGKVT